MFKSTWSSDAPAFSKKAASSVFVTFPPAGMFASCKMKTPVLTEPPAIAAFALVDLATLAQLYQRAESSGGVQ